MSETPSLDCNESETQVPDRAPTKPLGCGCAFSSFCMLGALFLLFLACVFDFVSGTTLLVIGIPVFIIGLMYSLSLRKKEAEKYAEWENEYNRWKAKKAERNAEEEKRKKAKLEKKRQEVMRTPWWNLDSQRTLLIDTCIWMQPENSGIDAWLKWVLKNSAQKQWKIVLLNSALEEIANHQKGRDASKAALARIAGRRIERIQKRSKDRFALSEGSLARVSAYADPQFLEYLQSHQEAIFFTDDRMLLIRARNMIHDKKRVIEWSSFHPLP